MDSADSIDSQTPDPQSQDELAGAADSLNEQVDAAASGAQQLGDTLGQAVENGMASAEQSLDNFIDGLDNFLGRFS